LIFSGVFLINLVVNLLEARFDPDVQFAAPENYALWIACIVLGLLVALFTLRSTNSAKTVRLVGHVFQVVGAFGIALIAIDLPLPDPSADGYVGIPWTCPWILAYPLMVPSLPRLSIAMGVLSAFFVLIAVKILFLIEPGLPDPEPSIWFALLFLNLICVAWGTVGSVTINDLGRQVAAARRVGSYRLEQLLGKGGMGEVWEGRHRLLARPAAVKIIRPEMLGDDDDENVAVRRFEREAQATAALQSPHSVSLYDYGRTDEGTFYYVMELLDGMDLQSLVEQFGPVESERVVHWLRHACHSLAESHHNGLIHRDIKPANLYACRFGLEWDFLKILDFGLVKPMSATKAESATLTEEHSVTGTAAFLPPEIAMGETSVDGRADIYSLGCVAYWLLTGELVFEADTPLKMILQHASADADPPSARTEVEISPELDAVVLDCLQKDPARRPQSAAALRDRLDACAISPAWTQEHAQRWWETHRPARADVEPTETLATAGLEIHPARSDS